MRVICKGLKIIITEKTNTTSAIKRIRRHIRGQTHTFFAATAPGFESLCLDELSALPLSIKEAKITDGGVEFSGRVWDAYLTNLHLRTANRILMRIGEITASNFHRLKKKLAELPWEIYLPTDGIPDVNVSVRKSRLWHSDAIADIVRKSIRNRLGISDSPLSSQQIFVRGINDHFLFSIDTSGELLHKRGLKTKVGKAPIRETTAAAILKQAQYHPEDPLIEPLSGSGTFSLEAAMIAANIPAGWFREFAFTHHPSFESGRWKHIRREAEKQIALPNAGQIFASDKDPKACAELEKTVEQHGLSQLIRVDCKDFFDILPTQIRPGLIIINPPYGRRIGTQADSENFFQAMGKHLQKAYPGWKAAIVVPHKDLLKYFHFKTRIYQFFHGGMKLFLMIGKIAPEGSILH